MPQQPNPAVMNQFNLGLKSEFTGLNFPENAATSTQNCIFNRIGNTTRRPGIDYELNFTTATIDRTGFAVTSFVWSNAGGDGNTKVLVLQVSTTLYFYLMTAATITSPLSTQKLAATVDMSLFSSNGLLFPRAFECQYAVGNGYLFVFHPSINSFYCTYSAGTITANQITLSIRDFVGVPEIQYNPFTSYPDDFRWRTGAGEHLYNLQNQGWTNSPNWSATSSTSNNTNTGTHTWIVQTGLPVVAGQIVVINATLAHFFPCQESGTVTSYNSGSGSLVVNVTSSSLPSTGTTTTWAFTCSNSSYITTWNTATGGGYPSSSDVWWTFKNSSGVFDPATTINNVTLGSGPAPKGHYLLNPFNQTRSTLSGYNLANITTLTRPKTGTWFQGRVWYAGVDDSDVTHDTTWSENIYFSQIITRTDQFGKCFQQEDPTSETAFDLLPSDGGVIVIQGCGSIFKLFPIQNGLLVFAANGVWFITGSAGIGFTANDYTINKISAIQSISSTSFVDVRGAPMWWNEEGIYTVSAGQGDEGLNYGSARGAAYNAGLKVESLSFTSIQSFYDSIPLSSKKHVKGEYDPLNWEVRWIYKNVEETDITSRYQYDSELVYNTTTQAFYPWNLSTTAGVPYINGINYIQNPGGTNTPAPTLKYVVSKASGGSYLFTFAEETDTTRWVDWHSSGTDYNFISYFISGFGIKGMAQHKFQTDYIWLYLNNYTNMSYKLQGIWDYAISGNSGKFTNLERTDITEDITQFGIVHRRHRVRGRGLVLQYKVVSVDGKPFDVIGWSIDNMINQGV